MTTYWCLISLPSLTHHLHPIHETLVAQIELRSHILMTSISLHLNYSFEILVISNHISTHTIHDLYHHHTINMLGSMRDRLKWLALPRVQQIKLSRLDGAPERI